MQLDNPRIPRLPSRLLLGLVLLLPAPCLAAAAAESNIVYPPELYGALSHRLVGPFRGGRVTAVSGVADEPFTFYFGSTGGGVWKTSSAGEAWANVTDGHIGVGSIGAIAVAPSDSNVVYIGTGSACPRGNVSAGDGLYKSTDAGKSWRHIGLGDAGQIGRIEVHPDNPDLVFVAVLGHIFGPNEQRGVYRSLDGGESWERVLYSSREAGAVDLALSPRNPREVYASIWRAERKPWTMIDGGEQSGLFKSTDGGDTWRELTGTASDDGLPGGVLGRIGVDVSPARPQRVWALISAPEGRGGLYRSEDSGETWRRVSTDNRLTTRGWYYTHVHAHPSDPNTLFVSNVHFLRSIDGGKSFERRPVPHGDNHDLWINPENSEIMIQANDGGANVTLDGGETWSTQHNQPTAEFYRVTVDNQFPFRLYGAQQDNSTISVPAWSSGALAPEQEWYGVGGGESGHIAVHPDHPDIVYAGTYIGRIDRYDRRSRFGRNVVIYPQMQDGTAPKDLEHRFQWNAPIRFSPHDPEVIYHTSNRVHRSRDGGMSWQTISPDLTRDEPDKQQLPGGPVQHDHTGVEVFNTIFAFEESPHSPGVLWAGADDGLVHLSRDDGQTWRQITPADMQPDSTVNRIALSSHKDGRAFLAVHRYRLDDFRPYIWHTDDFGDTWRLLTDGTNGIPANHFVRAVVEDPDRRGLLYAGTEFGLYISFDDGTHWQTLQLDLPITPITDLEIHEKHLIVATQGRSFWILDDLTPLHQLDDQVASAEVHLFRPRGSYRIQGMARFDEGRGPKPPDRGATLFYWLAAEPEEAIQLEILSSEGELLRTFHSRNGDSDGEEPTSTDEDADEDAAEPELPADKGMNRFVWDLKRSGPDVIEGSLFSLAYTGDFYVLPGRYTARLTVGDRVQEQPLEVFKDPRLVSVTADDLRAQNELIEEIITSLEEVHDGIRALRSVRNQLRQLAARLEQTGYEGDWQDRAGAIADRLDGIEDRLIQTGAETRQDLLNLPPRLDDQLAYLYSEVYRAYGRPTQGSYQRLEDLRRLIAPHLATLEGIWDNEIAAFNESLHSAGVPPVVFTRSREPVGSGAGDQDDSGGEGSG